MKNAHRFLRAGLILAAALAAGVAGATDALPSDSYAHVGVGSCAQSTCHGSVKPWLVSPVQQNEYFVWRDHDRHAQAFSVLDGDRGRAIAARLGAGDATKMPLCLGCHAENIPAAQRGPQFSIGEGVGCEACHGAAQKWIGMHTAPDADMASLLGQGFYPTAAPAARAQLCAGCHEFGARGADHRLMAAGHPAFADDLASYLEKWPKHYTVDADYIARKHPPEAGVQASFDRLQHAADWAGALARSTAGVNGVFPEFSFFRCDSCHRPAEARDTAGRTRPRLNDSAVRALLADEHALDPAQRTQIAQRLEQLSAGLDRGDRAAYAAAAQALNLSLRSALAAGVPGTR
ncbi:multiheme c-type cytochrome [Solimonas terrae]|uniref:Cytochrome c domain-containing protein n=1 Tax=Solimonas terrae TaxID=1396819 RepID=A0A6M2BUK8_9GAMM|nr:multiheme c-type cytochrome [Solimonas terrae]NGY06050.1 hypothetical protein [Solimonas terrae]